jgi:hypothetical protein
MASKACLCDTAWHNVHIEFVHRRMVTLPAHLYASSRIMRALARSPE